MVCPRIFSRRAEAEVRSRGADGRGRAPLDTGPARRHDPQAPDQAFLRATGRKWQDRRQLERELQLRERRATACSTVFPVNSRPAGQAVVACDYRLFSEKSLQPSNHAALAAPARCVWCIAKSPGFKGSPTPRKTHRFKGKHRPEGMKPSPAAWPLAAVPGRRQIADWQETDADRKKTARRQKRSSSPA